MEKCNVVETTRTPEHEILRKDADWDKHAAQEFKVETPRKDAVKPERQ